MSDNEAVFKPLAIQAQSGDARAYHELLNGVHLFLKNYLKRRIFEKNDIEEVVQEVLLAVHRSLHTYDGQKLFMGWFMSIVEYKITDYIRSQQKRKGAVSLDVISEAFAEADADLRLDIENAINRLNPKEKNVLTELKLKGYSVHEVAKALQLSEANVKVIAHRAYTNLKQQFGGKI